MNAFVIPNLKADCQYGYQIYLNLPEAKTLNRGIMSNLQAYSPVDEQFPENKIMNFMDGERREGWLNFYFTRFTDNSCYIFGFGLNHQTETSELTYVGQFQAFPDVISKLTERLNKAVEDSADEFRRLYTARNPQGIKNLVSKIIHSIK